MFSQRQSIILDHTNIFYFSKNSDSDFCQGFFRFCEHHNIRFQIHTQVRYNRKPYSNGTVDPCLEVADFQLLIEKNP